MTLPANLQELKDAALAALARIRREEEERRTRDRDEKLIELILAVDEQLPAGANNYIDWPAEKVRFNGESSTYWLVFLLPKHWPIWTRWSYSPSGWQLDALSWRNVIGVPPGSFAYFEVWPEPGSDKIYCADFGMALALAEDIAENIEDEGPRHTIRKNHEESKNRG